MLSDFQNQSVDPLKTSHKVTEGIVENHSSLPFNPKFSCLEKMGSGGEVALLRLSLLEKGSRSKAYRASPKSDHKAAIALLMLLSRRKHPQQRGKPKS